MQSIAARSDGSTTEATETMTAASSVIVVARIEQLVVVLREFADQLAAECEKLKAG